MVTRFVDKYIESRALDVVTPLDLSEAINHGHGLKGTIAEMYTVDEEHTNIVSWRK